MRTLTFQDVLSEEQYPQAAKKGERGQTEDGRQWVYIQVEEAITSIGSALTRVADTDADTAVSSNDSRGDATIITEADSSWTVGDYEDAYGLVNDGTGEGQFFKVKNNPSSTVLHLYTEYKVSTALVVTDSDLLLVRPFYVDLTAATTSNQVIVGVAQNAFTDEYYGWVLTRGPGAVLMGEAPTANYSLTPGDDTEGSCLNVDNGDDLGDASQVGRLLAANTNVDKACMADVCIL